jgi:hypothetical protein
MNDHLRFPLLLRIWSLATNVFLVLFTLLKGVAAIVFFIFLVVAVLAALMIYGRDEILWIKNGNASDIRIEKLIVNDRFILGENESVLVKRKGSYMPNFPASDSNVLTIEWVAMDSQARQSMNCEFARRNRMCVAEIRVLSDRLLCDPCISD